MAFVPAVTEVDRLSLKPSGDPGRNIETGALRSSSRHLSAAPQVARKSCRPGFYSRRLCTQRTVDKVVYPRELTLYGLTPQLVAS